MINSSVMSFFTKEAAIMTSRDLTGVPMSSQELLDKYNDANTRLPVDIAKWTGLGGATGALANIGYGMYRDGGVDLDKRKLMTRGVIGAVGGGLIGGLGSYAENRLERALTKRFLTGRGIDPETVPAHLSGNGVRLDKVASGMTYDYMKRRKEISMPKPESIKLEDPLQKMHRKHIKGLKQPRMATKRITSAGIKGKPISLGGNPRARLGLKRNQS